MGKRADALLAEFRANLENLRENYGWHKGAATMSAKIADENKHETLAAYHAGQDSGLNTALELLDDLIGEWSD